MAAALHATSGSCARVSCFPAARNRACRLLVRAQAEPPPARAVPLQGTQGSEAFWLLDPLQDRFFNVHGPDFIIQRPESFAHVFPKLRLRKLHQRETHLTVKSSLAQQHHNPTTALAVRPDAQAQPLPVLLHGKQPAFDLTQLLEEVVDPAPAPAAPSGSSCGVVLSSMAAMPRDLEPVFEGAEGQEVFVGSSTSPRRTKMIGFTCMRCKARTYKPINPLSFEEGTLVVQCGKCQCWHKIRDHLHLFHDMTGDLFFRASPITEADIPETLRMPLEPFYWMDGEDAA